MAGSFPDPPNNRFAYDKDGSYTYVVYRGSDQTANYTATDLANLNNPFAVTGALGVGFGPVDPCSAYIGVLFPELRTVTHVFWSDNMSPEIYLGWDNGYIEYSANSTNGMDGTWVRIDNMVFANKLPIAGKDRNNISSVGSISAKAIRVYRYNYDLFGGVRYHCLNIYGDRPTNITRLGLWRPTEDVEVSGADLDFGNVTRGMEYTKTFRVKNYSSSQTANTVTLSIDVNGDATPPYADQFTLSYDGGAFGSTASVGNLSAGAVSGVCTVKGTISSSAALISSSVRIKASAASWT